MKYLEQFPVFKTRVEGVTERYDLNSVSDRKKYFEAKAGTEIEKLKKYFESNSFIAYLLAKKSAGKGTYTKLMREIFGDVIEHISVGDLVRSTHTLLENGGKEADELLAKLKERYRGYISFEDAVDALLGRTQDKLLPSEFILTLVENEIDKLPKKILFIDGLPRDLDQISYTLFFRSLIDYRKDPDVFIAIDVPESVIDERMKYRVVCPVDQTPRNTKLLITERIGYDKDTGEFYLMCDNDGERMVAKEGDEAGIESIRERIDRDQKLMDTMFELHGVSKILVRNAVPVDGAEEYVDDYELTPAYSFSWDEKEEKVEIHENPWTAHDDQGVEVYSLLPAAAVLALIKQLTKVLGL